MGSTGLFGLDSDLEKACGLMRQQFHDAIMQEVDR